MLGLASSSLCILLDPGRNHALLTIMPLFLGTRSAIKEFCSIFVFVYLLLLQASVVIVELVFVLFGDLDWAILKSCSLLILSVFSRDVISHCYTIFGLLFLVWDII